MERKKRGFYLIKGSVAVQNLDWERDLCVIGSIVRVPFISGRQPFSIVNRPLCGISSISGYDITSSFNRFFLLSR
jgi:hypothetical protein